MIRIRLLLAIALLFGLAAPAWAAGYVPVSGAGSTWSSNALAQWATNVKQYGMVVNYAATGSSDGRNQFRAGTVDFGVSEIPYGLSDGGVLDPAPDRPYAYMPIVAGGTSFMYNLKIGNAQVTNLRLSGDVLAKIFTGVITNWSDPAIKADNPGLTLPARKIVPVVRSDGSGTSAQFTTWMASQHQAVWDDYCRKAGRSTPCGFTSIYPQTSSVIAQSGSLGVAGYVAAPGSEGAITYVEYSYALKSGFPVAKMLNQAGYYTEPTASNVAVALLNAQIDTSDPHSPSYLTQKLGNVYVNGDDRTYPLSSYSYMIVPLDTSHNFSNDKGHTLGDFGNYFLCQGQQEAPDLGYSPLPINLVQAGLDQVRRIPGVNAQSVDIAKCNNPTFSTDGSNTLAKNAPHPSPCDRKGTTQCENGTGGASKQSTPVSLSAKGGTTGGTTGNTGVAGKTGGPSTSGVPGAGGINPDTGQSIDGNATGSSGALAVPVSVDLPDNGQRALLVVAAIILLLGLVFGPPVAARLLRRGGDR